MNLSRRPVFAVLAAMLAAPALAATTTFNGSAIGNCSYDGPTKTYTCSQLPLGQWDDKISIPSGYTVKVSGNVKITYNQGLAMSGTASLQATGSLDISELPQQNLSVTGGSLVAGGAYKMGDQAQSISANITAASMNLGGGSAITINGTLTSTGSIAIPSHATINGNISSATGNITTTSPITINGNVTATQGSFSVPSGSTVTGDVKAYNVTLEPSPSKVIGNVEATNTLDIGSGSGVQGNVKATNAVLRPSEAYVTGTAAVTNITLGYHGTIQQGITCQAGDCSCVTNNSDYPAQCQVTPPSTLHHIAIEYASPALTCQTHTVTVKACQNDSCSTAYTTGTTVKFSNAAIPDLAIGNSGQASFTISPASFNTGTPLALTTSVPGAAKTQCSTAGCALAWTDQGFDIVLPGERYPIAGTTADDVTVKALRTTPAGTCTALFTSTTTNVTIKCPRVDPISGTMWPKVGAATASLSCDNSSGATVPLAFGPTGSATLKVAYEDVGSFKLSASFNKPAPQPALITGTSQNSFTFVPDKFAFTTTGTTTISFPDPNVAAPAVPAPFAKSGVSTPMQLVALNKLGKVTPNFGNESSPEQVVFTSARTNPPPPAPPAPDPQQASVLPSNNSVLTMSNGVAGITAVWDEAGLRLMEAKLKNTGGYMNTGKFPTASQSALFVPHHFKVQVVTSDPAGYQFPSVWPTPCADKIAGCSHYVFSGQPFQLSVSALNATNQPTINYGGDLARNYTIYAVSALGADETVAATRNPGYNSLAATPLDQYTGQTAVAASQVVVNVSNAATAFTAGVSNASVIGYRVPAKDTPRLVYFRARNEHVTSANTTTPASSTDAAMAVVWGRAAIANVYGSPTLPLPVTIKAEYWDGAAYRLSGLNTKGNALAADKPSSASANVLTYVNCQGQLKQNTSTTGPGPCAAAKLPNLTASPYILAFANGKVEFKLPAPNVNGSVTLRSSPYSFLQDTPVPGQLTFGIYKSGPVIYMREVY